MAETKEFPTSAVLGVVTGVLLGDIGGIYEVLNYMTGESVFTHQIPRISREAGPVIIAMHPSVADAIAESELVTPENFREWLSRWEARYGAAIAVPMMDEGQHERIDPHSELAEKVHPSRIVTL